MKKITQEEQDRRDYVFVSITSFVIVVALIMCMLVCAIIPVGVVVISCMNIPVWSYVCRWIVTIVLLIAMLAILKAELDKTGQ